MEHMEKHLPQSEQSITTRASSFYCVRSQPCYPLPLDKNLTLIIHYPGPQIMTRFINLLLCLDLVLNIVLSFSLQPMKLEQIKKLRLKDIQQYNLPKV